MSNIDLVQLIRDSLLQLDVLTVLFQTLIVIQQLQYR